VRVRVALIEESVEFGNIQPTPGNQVEVHFLCRDGDAGTRGIERRPQMVERLAQAGASGRLGLLRPEQSSQVFAAVGMGVFDGEIGQESQVFGAEPGDVGLCLKHNCRRAQELDAETYHVRDYTRSQPDVGKFTFLSRWRDIHGPAWRSSLNGSRPADSETRLRVFPELTIRFGRNLMASRGKFKVFLVLMLTLLLVVVESAAVGAAKPVPVPVNVHLTSITIDPENELGTTTNAPGAWSTGLGDGLSQVGVVSKGNFVNIPQPTFALGEIDIPLVAGNNVFTLHGTGIFPSNRYYGAVLFFDGRAVHPQIAVYAANPNVTTGVFAAQPAPNPTVDISVEPADLFPGVIMGSANGGWYWDYAPGTAKFVAGDGSTVEVTQFTINAFDSAVDKVGHYTIGRDGTPDMVAKLTIRVTPPK
jgi:hypothetical protein